MKNVAKTLLSALMLSPFVHGGDAEFHTVVSPQSVNIGDVLKIKSEKVTPPSVVYKKEVVVTSFPPFALSPYQIPKMDPVATDWAKPVQIYSLKELQLLEALILLDLHKKPDMAYAHLTQIASGSEKLPDDLRLEVQYHLSRAALAIGLNRDVRAKLVKVIKDPAFPKTPITKEIIALLAKAAEPGDMELVSFLDPLIAQYQVPVTVSLEFDQYQINRAKLYIQRNELNKALAIIDEYASKEKKTAEVLFLKSVILYKSDRLNEAIKIARMVRDQNIADEAKEKNKSTTSSSLNSSISLMLGRMYFQQGKYKEANENYVKVDQKHPEWLDAMIEQSWTQILAQDFEGAAGNMFSLHLSHFNKDFAPESYISRVVSYMKLCQYGDSLKALKEFQRKYAPLVNTLQQYEAKAKSPAAFYSTLRTLLKQERFSDVDGLPPYLVLDWARQSGFVSAQKRINELELQLAHYVDVQKNLSKKEFSIRNLMAQETATLAKLKTSTQTTKRDEDIHKSQLRIVSYSTQINIIISSRSFLEKNRLALIADVDKEKETHKAAAAVALQKRFQEMQQRLTSALSQVSTLEYEVYAGAGEHLRYQTAGGNIKPKESDTLKPEKNQALNWQFNGEVWQDEIGHIRSSLKNVCPTSQARNVSQTAKE